MAKEKCSQIEAGEWRTDIKNNIYQLLSASWRAKANPPIEPH